MKKKLFLVSLLLGLVVCAMTLVSCGDDDEEPKTEEQATSKLTGKWKVRTSSLSGMGINYGDEIAFNSNGTAKVGNMTGTYSYNPSTGEFALTFGDTVITGTITFNGDSATITFTTSSGEQQTVDLWKDNGGKDKQQGEDAEMNTTDVAVTGPVVDYGALFAQIKGVVNLDVISASYTNVAVGVEVSLTSDFVNKKRVQASEVVGRTISVRFYLAPSTKYYYRTYVSVSTLSYDYYGETYSFTTNPINEDLAITGQVENHGYTRAQISGSINSQEIKAAAATASAGVEVSTKEDFSDARKVLAIGDIEKFVVSIAPLIPDTKYYYRTYLNVDLYPQVLYFYGKKMSFVTEALDTEALDKLDNTNHYVDLGLPSGTLWATMNVGASKPEEYGDYFAWGETEGYNSGKTYFGWSTYKWCKGNDNALTKYSTNGSHGSYGYNGFTDNKTQLDPEDDAAYVNWGSGWRMPTYDQLKELRDQCTWTLYTFNNVKGYLVEGKNGNVIFLPAAGHRYYASLSGAGSYGIYWSRTLCSDYPSFAWFLDFNSNSSGVYGSSGYRYCGRSVRPVRVSQ